MTHTKKFLHDSEPPRARQKRPWPIRILFVFIFVIFIWAGAFFIAAFSIRGSLLDAQNNLARVKEDIVGFAFDSAREYIAKTQTDLRSAKRWLPVARTAAWIPFVGDSIGASANIISIEDDIAMSFTPLIDLGADMIQLSGLSEEYFREVRQGISPAINFNDLSTQTKRAVLRRLSAGADDLDLLVAKFSILREEMDLLSRSIRISTISDLLKPLEQDLALAQEPLETLAIASHILPPFAGLDEPSSILLLFLNNDELRPGGGFIGTYGVLEMSGGDIARLDTVDVYNLDDVVDDLVKTSAPEPLQKYNATTNWLFRDSNWSPDFAVSSQRGVDLFLNEAASLGEDTDIPVADHIDHVIAFTPTFASELLEIIGPITVGGRTFTSENVAELLEYQVEFGSEKESVPISQRKEILADLVNEMKSRLYSLSAREWPAVFDVLKSALQEKQLLLYSTNAQVQQVLERAGWAGVVKPNTADSLMVVDANLASLKSDPEVQRDVTYKLYQDTSGRWIGRVLIHYVHNGNFDYKTTRYRTYTRVYLPEGSKFLGVEGNWLNDITQNPTRAKGVVDVEKEFGLVSFGTFTSVEPGEENTLIFEFAPDDKVVNAIASGDYALTVFKQAGSRNNALTLDLDFGKNVAKAIPPEEPGEWGDDTYRLNTILDQDLVIDVRF